jgi:hypothetical protein
MRVATNKRNAIPMTKDNVVPLPLEQKANIDRFNLAFDQVCTALEPLSLIEQLDVLARVATMLDEMLHPGPIEMTISILAGLMQQAEARMSAQP